LRGAQKRKKWEHKDVNPTTGKPILRKLHVHTGDQVIVISGSDKGLISEVTYVRARPVAPKQSSAAYPSGFAAAPRARARRARRAPAMPAIRHARGMAHPGNAVPCVCDAPLTCARAG
jgi:hypothetical protein